VTDRLKASRSLVHFQFDTPKPGSIYFTWQGRKSRIGNVGQGNRWFEFTIYKPHSAWQEGVVLYWLLMIAAILFEVLGTTCMKLSDGFRKLKPSIGLAVFYILCFGCLTLAIEKIDVSIAYALWSAMGTALITVIGITYFKEKKTYQKFISIGLIIIGVVGLNLSGTALE